MIVSALTEPTQLPLRSLATIEDSPVLVVAPHPDDETLGCGGAIALLRQQNCRIHVLVMSDGTMSHPRSRKFPPQKLRALRQQETLAALSILGCDDVTFLDFPDGAIPSIGNADYNSAIEQCRYHLGTIAPRIIFLPWRSDPHPDHRATWHLIRAAQPQSARLIEYPIWDWDPEQRGEIQSQLRFTGWRLDIQSVTDLKQTAIAQYRSQTTDLIDDDPEGFRLTPEMLANFTRPWELYLEEQQ